MRKLFFIALVLAASCTVKKQRQETVYTAPGEETDTVVSSKKFLYVDTAEESLHPPQVYHDSATTIIEAPQEDKSITYNNETTQDTVEVDTTVYRWQLAVAADSVKEWKNMKSFAYVKNLDSLLKAAKAKKQPRQEIREERTSSGGGSWLDALLGSGGLKIFLWILAGGFVLFVIYKLFVTEGSFKRKPKTVFVKTFSAEEELITPETDIDRMIREALQRSDYRLAVRYHYLQTLHLLAEKHYVQLAADKTNYSYVHEIKDISKQNGFAAITRHYEYVWYGEFNIDGQVYQQLKTAFQSFNTAL